jgi:hypothetical protein
MIIPLWVRILGPLALLAAVFVFGFSRGATSVRDDWNAANAVQAVKLAEAEARAANATAKVVTEYVDRVRVVREKAKTIVKEVPVYVTPEADAACVVPRGFVRVHDGAASNEVPGPAADSDADPSGVALSTVAEITAENYGTYHEVAEQLKALQKWVAEQQAAAKER